MSVSSLFTFVDPEIPKLCLNAELQIQVQVIKKVNADPGSF
jgi:hypothetical protein